MTVQVVDKTANKQPADFEQRVQKLREIYADGSEVSKTALENVVSSVQSGKPAKGSVPLGSAGRIGSRQGKVSEFTTIFPIKPAGAKRLRAFLELLHPDLGNREVDKVGTVHDMRFVFLDNDTRMLFATAYDGDWEYMPFYDGEYDVVLISAAMAGWRRILSRQRLRVGPMLPTGMPSLALTSEYGSGGSVVSSATSR